MARRCQPAEGIRPGPRHLYFVANTLSQIAGLDSEQLSAELHAEVLAWRREQPGSEHSLVHV